MPYAREGEGLHLPPVPEALNRACPRHLVPRGALPAFTKALPWPVELSYSFPDRTITVTVTQCICNQTYVARAPGNHPNLKAPQVEADRRTNNSPLILAVPTSIKSSCWDGHHQIQLQDERSDSITNFANLRTD